LEGDWSYFHIIATDLVRLAWILAILEFRLPLATRYLWPQDLGQRFRQSWSTSYWHLIHPLDQITKWRMLPPQLDLYDYLHFFRPLNGNLDDLLAIPDAGVFLRSRQA
jgi:hypothetical protein